MVNFVRNSAEEKQSQSFSTGEFELTDAELMPVHGAYHHHHGWGYYGPDYGYYGFGPVFPVSDVLVVPEVTQAVAPTAIQSTTAPAPAPVAQ